MAIRYLNHEVESLPGSFEKQIPFGNDKQEKQRQGLGWLLRFLGWGGHQVCEHLFEFGQVEVELGVDFL